MNDRRPMLYAVSLACLVGATTIANGQTAAETPRHVTVCTGEHEERCPPHDRFFGCPNKPRELMAKDVCQDQPREILLLGTRSGDKCGYAVLDIACPGGGQAGGK